MSTRTTIVLADDHHVVRQGLRALLEAEADLSVVGEAADGAAAIDMATRLAPGTRVVVLSMHSSEAYVVEALQSGASAYVHRYLSPLSERAIDAYTRRAHAATVEPHSTLTARELEVLRLAAQGYADPESETREGR